MDRKMPPGPNGLPIIGCFANLKPIFCIALERYGKKYGPIFTIKLGQRHVVIFNSYETLKASFIDQPQIFAGRPKDEFFHSLSRRNGFVFEDGEVYYQRKKTILSILKDYTFSKTGIMKLIKDETDDFMKLINSKKGYPFNYQNLFLNFAGNLINGIVIGERSASYDKNFRNVINSLDNMFLNSWAEYLSFFFPYLTHMPLVIKYIEWKTNRSHDVSVFSSYYKEKLRLHRINFDPNKEPENFLNAMLKLESNYAAEHSDYSKELYEEQIFRMTFDFYVGGMDPFGTALSWIFFLMAINPTAQDKVADEVIATFGKTGPIDYEKKSQMPYVSAVLDECMRYASSVPLAVPHKCLEDTKVMGYDIPKNIITIVNIYAIHRDPNYWEKPTSFYPEHFLSKDGKEYKPNEHLVFFSAGERLCLAWWIANWGMFQCLTTVLRDYHVDLCGNLSKCDIMKLLVGSDGGIRRLGAHQLSFKYRK